jgi:hypothetical protein
MTNTSDSKPKESVRVSLLTAIEYALADSRLKQLETTFEPLTIEQLQSAFEERYPESLNCETSIWMEARAIKILIEFGFSADEIREHLEDPRKLGLVYELSKNYRFPEPWQGANEYVKRVFETFKVAAASAN